MSRSGDTETRANMHGKLSQEAPKPTRNLPETDPKPTRNRPETDPTPTRDRPDTDPKPTRNQPETDPKPTRTDVDFARPVGKKPHNLHRPALLAKTQKISEQS